MLKNTETSLTKLSDLTMRTFKTCPLTGAGSSKNVHSDMEVRVRRGEKKK